MRRLELLFGLLAIVALATAARAHEGHEHGERPAVVASSHAPRALAQSEAHELVGILRGDRLTLYLDRFDTNQPVTDARIAVTIGADPEVVAQANADGTYAISSPALAGEGALELVFNIAAPGGDDLLIATLERPARSPAAAAVPPRPALFQGLQNVPALRLAGVELGAPYLVAGGALLLGVALGLALRSRRWLVPITGIAVVVVILSSTLVRAHEGEPHSGEDAKRAGPSTDTPQRLPDGGAFVPKPSQRLLELRTVVARHEMAQRSTALIGHVIADPNRSGLVQSINGGRVMAPEKGLPQLGQTVAKGDVLAVVETPIIAADRATLAEKVGDIEQQIALAEARLVRARRLVATGAGTLISVSDAELELEGLKRRREAVRDIRSAPEMLSAPVDGTIASSRVVAGQVVQAQDILFQIVDPKGLWVEAALFHDSDMPVTTGATATTTDGTRLRLAFRGTSRAMQQQTTVVQFSVVDPPASLSLGQPVTVAAPSGPAETGIILPREAMVRGANGETLVWRHTEPERFEPRPVRAEAFDASRVVVRAGVERGDRIVIRGAELINQIR